MKVDQNNTMNKNTLSIHLSDVSNTADMKPSPPDHLSDNHSELIDHPQMIFRSEHCN